MKIVSKHKDYYDAGLVYGIDEKLYFKRDQITEEIETDFEGDIFCFQAGENKFDIKIFPLLIGFCGDFTPLCKIIIDKTYRDTTISYQETVYTYEDFLDVFKKIGCKISSKKTKYYHGPNLTKDILLFGNTELYISLESIDCYLNGIEMSWSNRGEEKSYSDFMSVFSEKQVAYFIVGVNNVVVDKNSYGYTQETWQSFLTTHPILKDYKFSQVKDAYTAFQEISMFLGNMNNPDDQMLKPDDKYVAYSKGFCSHSFKKKPTKSKEKPCDTKTSLE